MSGANARAFPSLRVIRSSHRLVAIKVSCTAKQAGNVAPILRVTLMGEKLVAFRETAGRIGLLQKHCPHRTASLFFGHNEECGIHCIHHGWKFDIEGNCVYLPA